MKYSYFLLITASMLLIPATSLDAMKADTIENTQKPKPLPPKTRRFFKKPSKSESNTSQDPAIHSTVLATCSKTLVIPPPPPPPDQVAQDVLPLKGGSIVNLESQPTTSQTIEAQPNERASEHSDQDASKDSAFENSESCCLVESDSDISEDSDSDELDEYEEVIAFCNDDRWFSSGPVSSALNWALKQTITPEERTTAVKEMTDGLRKLCDENKNNFEELKKLMTTATLETLKTDILISALEISEKINKRLEAGSIIINNKADIQINEKDLNDFNQLSQEYIYHVKTIFGTQFDFGNNKLFRKDQMRRRIQKKSLQPDAISYKPLSLDSIIAQVTNTPEEFDKIESECIEDDGNDSEIDEETQAATDHYSASWTFFTFVRKGLAHARQSTIDKNLATTAKKEMTDALQEKMKQIKDDYENTESTDNTDEVQSLIKEMKRAETVQRRLEAIRFIMKNKSGVQLDEEDLSDFNNICRASQNRDLDVLKQSFTLTCDRVKKIDEMCSEVCEKSLQPEQINYASLPLGNLEIFNSSNELFNKLKAEAKANQLRELTPEAEEN